MPKTLWNAFLRGACWTFIGAILSCVSLLASDESNSYRPAFSLSGYKPRAIAGDVGGRKPQQHAAFRDSWSLAYPGREFVWKIGYLNHSAREFPTYLPDLKTDMFSASLNEGETFIRIPRYLGRFKKYHRAPEFDLSFAVPQGGDYTLVLAFSNAKNTWNGVQVILDGKELSSFVLDGNNPGSTENSYNRFACKTTLTTGQHRLTLKLASGQWVVIDAVALLKGSVRARFNADEFVPVQTKPDGALWSDLARSRKPVNQAVGITSLGGDDVDLVIDAPAGKYRAQLFFSESFDQETTLCAKAGERLFDVLLNGNPLFKDYDIFARSKGTLYTHESIAVDNRSGKIVLTLKSSRKTARISRIKLTNTDTGKIRDYQFTETESTYILPESQKGYYDSPYNLVPNPGFEYLDASNRVVLWNTFGMGKARQDSKEKYSGENSVNLSGSTNGAISMLRANLMGMAAWDTPYSLSCMAKSKGRGRVRLKLLWFRQRVQYLDSDVKSSAYIERSFQDEYAGVSYGDWVEVDGNWRKLSFTAIPPRAIDRVGFALEWENASGEVLVDDFFFDGKGARAVEISASALYNQYGVKRAVIFTTGDGSGAGKYILRRADNTLVQVKELKSEKDQSWTLSDGTVITDNLYNRKSWSADFSDVTETGRYFLEVIFKDGQMQRTPVFEIQADLYKTLGEYVITNYYNTIRCGTEVEGWHPPCHMDDGDYLLSNGKRRHSSIHGGWHDAGDNNIFNFNVINSIYTMSHYIADTANGNPEVFSELMWGTDYQVRGLGDDGSLIISVLNKPVHGFHRPVNEETDNDPATPDNRIIRRGIWVSSGLTCAATFLNVANQLDNTDKEKANLLRQSADKVIGYYAKRGAFKTPSVAPYALLCAAPMQKTDYPFQNKLDAASRLEEILDSFDNDIENSRWPHENSGESHLQFIHVMALIDYSQRFPNDSYAPRIKSALRKFCDNQIIPATKGSVFGQVQEIRAEDAYHFKPRGNYDISHRYYVGYLLAASSILLEDRQLLTMAEKQILWGIGLNPVGISSVGGIGWREQNAFNLGSSRFYGHENGQYPGATHHALVHEKEVHTTGRTSQNYIPKYIGGPLGFLSAGLLADTPSFPQGSEQYIAHAAPLVLACGKLSEAFKVFNSKENR
jgi:hypothetical protein